MSLPPGLTFPPRRDTEDDIVGRDPNAIVTALRAQYRRSTHVEIGNVKDVEPVVLVRYEPGVVLFVRKVQIDRDRVRLMLHNQAGDEATFSRPVGPLTSGPLLHAAPRRAPARRPRSGRPRPTDAPLRLPR